MDNFIKMQSKFVQQINNCKKLAKFPQAILIEGSSDLVLDNAIKYTIASLLCDDNPACLKCDTCQKTLTNNLIDVIEFDLKDETLKKENVLEIQKRFSKTALESTNKQIYVIKYIESASSIVMNALLKFLEEPNENVYAIFTTNNVDKVLETIISRTIKFRLAYNDKTKIKEILEGEYSSKDIDIALLITSDEAQIKMILDGRPFITFKENANKIFRNIYTGNFYLAIYELLNDFEKEELSVFFELFYTSLTNIDILANFNVEEEIINKIKNTENLDIALDVILSSRLQLETNMNKALIIDKFSIQIEGAML
ncbi:DNA polymerase-3 subunit delta' [Bacilli bacterium PM5-3]|nr:DNA polymerase-3 subunit delta' [Bacilli bacterium PM5-3]MDH6603678.1 DNA polymerase-3 subunit delta' [Bacilli bacterium PM5-9]